MAAQRLLALPGLGRHQFNVPCHCQTLSSNLQRDRSRQLRLSLTALRLTAVWDTAGPDTYVMSNRHQGGRQDAATGHVHFRHRDLDTLLGRWVQQDPAGTDTVTQLVDCSTRRPIARPARDIGTRGILACLEPAGDCRAFAAGRTLMRSFACLARTGAQLATLRLVCDCLCTF